ncbi:MAG: 4-hydroxyphenylacetate 3-hydroxylase N-terminal domain-containing protein [Rhodospirillales bacterium]
MGEGSTEPARPTPNRHKFLMTGEQYLESQRDGRVVYYKGEVIEDVTTHPATGGGIRTIARLYDHQHDPAHQDAMTYLRSDGERASMSFMVPRTKEDLRRRRRAIEHISRETFGFYGRGIDMIAMVHVGMLGVLPTFRKHCPEYAENLVAYRDYAEERNLHLAEIVAEPQGVRGRTAGTPPDTPLPDRAVARIVRESSKGIWISGVKAVATAGAQAHDITIGRVYPTPNLEECFWVAIPANAPGVKQFCRELTGNPDSSPDEHPVTAFGEETDGLLAMDEVFVPRERIFAMKSTALHDTNLFNTLARHEHWYTLTRMAVKAEMYAGLGRVLCDTLDLVPVPAVRQRIADLYQVAQILRGMVIASEEMGEMLPGDVFSPNANLVTAARAYALETMPMVLATLQDLSGMGLMVRLSDKDLDVPVAFGKPLSWFLDQKDVSARDKDKVMDLVWDVTCSGTAQRVKLFEVANAQNLPFLKERLFREYPVQDMADACRSFIGLGPAGRQREVDYKIRWDWSAKGQSGV